MAKLHFVDKNFAGQVYELVVEKTTVGRGEQNTLVIAHDSVSSTHCEILAYGEEVIVRERGSSNGTFVDGVRIEGQTALHHGQTLRFGSVEARIEIEPDHEQSAGLTAFHEHGKVMREQHVRAKKEATAHARVDPATAAPLNKEQTVLLPNTRRKREQAAAQPKVAAVDKVSPTKSRTALYVALVAGALIAAIMIWLVQR